jgi:hypothetical protein
MADNLLTRKQWNELAEMIQERRLAITDFEQGMSNGVWAGFPTSEVPAVRYRRRDFWFAISDYVDPRRPGHRPSTFAVQMRPGTERQTESFGDMGWSNVRQAFHQWLVNLQKEVEAPDLWQQLSASRDVLPHLTPPNTAENTPFSPSEQDQLRRELEALRSSLEATYNLTATQTQAIRADISYLSERVGKLERMPSGQPEPRAPQDLTANPGAAPRIDVGKGWGKDQK